ncbi:hypothetical protein D1007_35749 [Hordeum vulgare]|nr:hypothetical protein D1007_35749 [Hordeum vulgare]
MGVPDSALWEGVTSIPRRTSRSGEGVPESRLHHPRGLTRSDDNHIGTPMSHEGDHADPHYSKRHDHDPTDSPSANRYEQRHRGDLREWLREDAQHGCTRGAPLLVGSCPRQTSGSGTGDLSPWTGWTHPHIQVEAPERGD